MTEYGVAAGEVRDVSNLRIDVNTNQNRHQLNNSFDCGPSRFVRAEHF
jgi:hypothetical protein